MNNILILLSLITFLNSVLSNSCKLHETCSKCIRDPSLCVWCASTQTDLDYHCKPVSSNTTWCSEPLVNPINNVTDTENRNFSSSPITQLRPQKYNLILRTGEEAKFDFYYKGVQGYPIDVYFIFDASTSMNKTIGDTAVQSKQIYESLREMTSDVNLGMGTFIDKNVLPFTQYVNNNLAYSFRHHLNMTDNYTVFQRAVEDIKIGENKDNPEGGLDAVAQAIICKEKFKWRTDSRKIVVLLTNGPFHAAGDGRSAGIFKPYDGKCHTVNGKYTKELEMDYPSISMINKLAREEGVIVIFLVNTEQITAYDRLASKIRGSRAEVFDQKNNDITNILKNIYEDISKSIKLNWNVRDGRKRNYDISFEPDCSEEKVHTDKEPNNCTTRIGKEHAFIGKIKLKEYDALSPYNLINITVKGINEKIELNVTVIGNCDCENKIESNSPHCNNEKLVCGKCQCSGKTYGNNCACIHDKENKIEEKTCIAPNQELPCNGRGACICGACACITGKGKYCECNTNCEVGFNNQPCSGIANGECQCDGLCKCADNRIGSACQCDKQESIACLVDDKVCNNRGNCECGSNRSICECEDIASWDKRQQQNDKCVVQQCSEPVSGICHNRQCSYLDKCAICLMSNPESCNETCSELKNMKYDIIQELSEEKVENVTEWRICPKVRVDAGCYSPYAYMYDTKEYRILLKLQRSRDCNKIFYTTAGAILGTILFIGILTMVAWKLINDYRDRKEFEKFVKDHENDAAVKCENPLYERPTTMINNPAFRKRSINHY